MRTPAGKQCTFYYEDFNRGREIQRCDLANAVGQAADWQVSLCAKCPVPRLQLANACKHMVIHGQIKRGFLGINKQMSIHCTCLKSLKDVAEPEIGCGQCHADNPVLKALLGE
ncbi:MAG TPA: hypothetical protein PK299_08745 [Anaerolineales bacterium]|nr:hypothetical protein [Anaerolineales bacterium]